MDCAMCALKGIYSGRPWRYVTAALLSFEDAHKDYSRQIALLLAEHGQMLVTHNLDAK